ncbi:MAG: LytTR family transcriptional regulator [Roseivirga sp.]|nr:LytTR family transcriptional regulator [Roseivirga sp.]
MTINSLHISLDTLTRRKQILFIFSALNTLALLHFGLLQLRHLFSDYYFYNQTAQVVWHLSTYNIWAIGAMMLISYLPTKAKWYQHLGFFMAITSIYSLCSSLVHNDGLYQIWRGLIINMTGQIHLNILYYLTIILLIRSFRTNSPVSTKLKSKLVIEEGKITRCFDKEEIVYIKAEQNYVTISLVDGKTSMLRKTLKEVEELIPDPEFLRIQRSYIVNRNFIAELNRAANGTDLICRTTSGEEFPVSRKKKDWLRSKLALT